MKLMSRQSLDEAAIRAPEVFAREDARACDEQAGSGVVHVADVLRADAAVDLDVHVSGKGRAQAANAVDCLRHELLPGVPGVDAHAKNEVEPRRDLCDILRLGRRVEGETRAEPV